MVLVFLLTCIDQRDMTYLYLPMLFNTSSKCYESVTCHLYAAASWQVCQMIAVCCATYGTTLLTATVIPYYGNIPDCRALLQMLPCPIQLATSSYSCLFELKASPVCNRVRFLDSKPGM